MKKLKTLLLLLVVLFLLIGCNDDDKKDPEFSLDIGAIDSAENVSGRDFGIYKWDFCFYEGTIDNEDIMNNFVLVVPYNELQKELIFSGQATVELTLKDSTYYPYPIDSSWEYTDFHLDFMIEGFQSETESYTIKYIQGENEKIYSITIPYVNYLTELSFTDVISNGPKMTFNWDLANNNNYQLLSSQQSYLNSYEDVNAFFCKRLKKAIRKFTFPQEYNFVPIHNNYYSIAQVKQTQTSELIGLSLVVYGVNVDEDGWDKQKSYDAKEMQRLVRKQFELLHKPILDYIRIKN